MNPNGFPVQTNEGHVVRIVKKRPSSNGLYEELVDVDGVVWRHVTGRSIVVERVPELPPVEEVIEEVLGQPTLADADAEVAEAILADFGGLADDEGSDEEETEADEAPDLPPAA